MSAMGDLRLSLLEHGVNYDEYGDGYTHWNYGGASYTAQQNIVGKLIVCNLTPQQAIDATLGREECEPVVTDCNDGLLPPFTVHCSACGDEWGFTPNYCPHCGRKVKRWAWENAVDAARTPTTSSSTAIGGSLISQMTVTAIGNAQSA